MSISQDHMTTAREGSHLVRSLSQTGTFACGLEPRLEHLGQNRVGVPGCGIGARLGQLAFLFHPPLQIG